MWGLGYYMSQVLENLVDEKILRLVNFFLKNDDKLFHLYTISTEANVPMGSTHRLISKIVKSGIVEVVVVGKTKLYRTNRKMPKVIRKVLEVEQ